MTSYDRAETFALYLAVLKKDEPSPLLPESDEDTGVGAAPARESPDGELASRDGDRRAPTARAGHVQIDFDGLQQRIIAGARRPVSGQYAQLRAGARRARCIYLEAPAGAGAAARRRRGSTLHRYRLSERRAARLRQRRRRVRGQRRRQEARSIARRARRRPKPRRRNRVRPRAVPRRRRSQGADGRARGGSTRRCACTSIRRQEFAQIFNEGWRLQRDYLYVPNMHGSDWPRMKQMYGAAAAARDASRRPQLPARQHGRRDRHRPLLRARRRHARRAAVARRAARRRLRRSRADATRSRASTTARAGIPICARRSPRRASTSPSATSSSPSTASSSSRRTTSTGCSTAPRTGRPC